MLAKNSGKAWNLCSNCMHTLQYLVVPVERGSALSVLHAACCCLICHPFPFICDCAWEAGRLFAPLSVASVIFLLLYTVKTLSLPIPPFCLSPFGICAERWKQTHLSWLLKRQKVYSDVCMAHRDTEITLGMKRWVFGWRKAICFSDYSIVYLLVGSGRFTYWKNTCLAYLSLQPFECICDPV